jgi:Immunity protein 26
MRTLKPTRKQPRAGDVFTLAVRDNFLFGRVITTDAKAGWSMPGARLIYIFRTHSRIATLPDRGVLQATNLLVPPIMTNNVPWSRGYFEALDNLPFQPGEVLPLHCFRASHGTYFDDQANQLPGGVEPCGDWGLHSFASIDDVVSDALLIPRAGR